MKYNILYDGTLFSYVAKYGDGCRTGIYFVSINILYSLLKRKDVSVSFFCYNKNLYYFLRKYQRIDKKVSGLDIIVGYNFLGKCVAYFIGCKAKASNVFSKLFYTILLIIFRLLYAVFPFDFFCKNKLKNYVYISSMYAVPKCLKNVDIKKFVILHDTIPLLFKQFYPEVDKGKYWFLDLINSMNNDEHYFAVSQSTKNDFLKFVPKLNPNNITVMPLASSDMFYKCYDIGKIASVLKKYNVPLDKKYIFSLCTIEPRKNLIFAIKNFIKFIEANDVDDLIFVLGGGHWQQFIDKFEKEIDNFDKYKEKIIRIGYVDDNDLAYLYSGAFCFVYPSLYEGFGLPPLEAMKCGTPVITSNNSSIPEVVGDAAIKINPYNDDELYNAYNSLYYDESLRKILSERGVERAKLFSWDKSVDIIKKEIIDV